MAQTKKCRICAKDKTLQNDFSKQPANTGGYSHECKTCSLHLARKARLKRKYGISFEDYCDLYKKQNGVCAICECDILINSAHNTHATAHVDHNHTTGRIRGLLCWRCNLGLGCFDDTLHGIEKAFNYLKANDKNV